VALCANFKRYNSEMLSQYFAYNLEDQLSKITEHGFCVMDNFLPQTTVVALAHEISTLNDAARMHEAGTGQTLVTMNKQLRGDSIYWLNEANASVAQKTYLKQMEILRLALNQYLYLGLFALESHLALYPIGASYKKHIDRFKTNNTRTIDQAVRQISCILYLNKDWHVEDGGYLRLYLNQECETTDTLHLDIAPIGGRLVMFLSDTFHHEVLPATRSRISLTGWFLTR
jgi:SM-20-related protein